MKTKMSSYLVRPEPALRRKREASFESLSSARYFARTWAYQSHVPILVVDCQSGEPVERYSSRTLWLAGNSAATTTNDT
jgi:hypothetical protein